jgi:hypothetical protein
MWTWRNLVVVWRLPRPTVVLFDDCHSIDNLAAAKTISGRVKIVANSIEPTFR